MNAPYALVIGESQVDVIMDGLGVRKSPGGSPANVAAGLGRLDHPVRLATWFGHDEHGRMVADHLARSHVEIVPGSDQAPCTSTQSVSADGSLAGHRELDLTWRLIDLPDAVEKDPPLLVHVGSVSATDRPGGDLILDAVRRFHGKSTISYAPSIRPDTTEPMDEARELVEEFVRLADIVTISARDLNRLYPNGDDSVTRVVRWASRGLALSVTTMGPGGSFGLCRSGVAIVPPPNVGPFGAFLWNQATGVEFPTPRLEMIDPIGATDAFVTGLLDGLWSVGLLGRGADALADMGTGRLEQLLRHAADAEGITLAQPGATMPWRADLPALPPGEAPQPEGLPPIKSPRV